MFRFKTLLDVFIHFELCYTLHERSLSKIHNRATLSVLQILFFINLRKCCNILRYWIFDWAVSSNNKKINKLALAWKYVSYLHPATRGLAYNDQQTHLQMIVSFLCGLPQKKCILSRSCWCARAGHQMSLCWAHGLLFVVGAMCSHVYCLFPLILLPNHCFSGSTCVCLVTLICLPI